MSRNIPASNAIVHYMHCKECLSDRPKSVAPREWASLEVGFTALGVQVWCKRHEINVAHIDFQDQQHPANLMVIGEN
jgi:hypothetical protein